MTTKIRNGYVKKCKRLFTSVPDLLPNNGNIKIMICPNVQIIKINTISLIREFLDLICLTNDSMVYVLIINRNFICFIQ